MKPDTFQNVYMLIYTHYNILCVYTTDTPWKSTTIVKNGSGSNDSTSMLPKKLCFGGWIIHGSSHPQNVDLVSQGQNGKFLPNKNPTKLWIYVMYIMMLPISLRGRCRSEHGPGFLLFEGKLRSCEVMCLLDPNCEDQDVIFRQKNLPGSSFVFPCQPVLTRLDPKDILWSFNKKSIEKNPIYPPVFTKSVQQCLADTSLLQQFCKELPIFTVFTSKRISGASANKQRAFSYEQKDG